MVPRWPQDTVGYREGGEAAGSSQQMLREKGVQIRKTPGRGPTGVPKQAATRVGVQWVVRRATEPNTLSPDTLPGR